MQRLALLLAAAAAPVALAVLAAGCGGGSGSPGVAAIGSTTTTTTADEPAASGGPSTGTSKAGSGAAFSSCMRSHGVPNFPDPTSGGGITIDSSSGIDPDSPRFQSAQRACRHLLPGGGKPPTPAQQAKMQAQALRFSACMRAHGVPSFPDPDFSGGGVGIKIRGGSGIDPNSPVFRSAQRACAHVLPGLPVGGKVSSAGGKGGGGSAGFGAQAAP